MRTLILVVLAIVLFALTTCVDGKPAAKASEITGYGKYKLGTPITQYYLEGFDGPRQDIFKSNDEWNVSYYHANTTLELGGQAPRTGLLLSAVNGNLESTSLVVANLDIEFADEIAYSSFAWQLYRVIISKYSNKLIQEDRFMGERSERRLWLKDKKGNTLMLAYSAAEKVIVLSYYSGLYNEVSRAQAIREEEERKANSDEGKI